MRIVNKAELTSSLRDYTEKRFDANEENVETLKQDTEDQFSTIFRLSDETNAYVKKVENENSTFRREYTSEMEKDSLLDLVPNLTPDDIKPDTDGNDYDIDADPRTNPKAGQARMVTLDQMQALFHVLLRRSKVRARLTTEE